jgi:amino acid permease
MQATAILVVVIMVLCASDAPHDPYTPLPAVTFSSLGTAFGVILFGFGGHAILPALQATMKDPTPRRFRQALFWSFSICTALYLSTSISSVHKLGGTVSGDVLTNFDRSVTNSFGLVSVTLHLLFAAVTVHIPIGQMIDHYCSASDFSVRQICIRATTMAMVGVVSWAAGGHFFCVIGLVGGTCSNAMIFIFPPWFYLRLLGKEEQSMLLLLSMGFIMFIGTAGMISTLIGAVDSCKDQSTSNHSHGNHTNHTNDRGMFGPSSVV